MGTKQAENTRKAFDCSHDLAAAEVKIIKENGGTKFKDF